MIDVRRHASRRRDALAGRMTVGWGRVGEEGSALRIAHGSDGVTAETADGRSWHAEAALLATGINPLAAIAFSPPLLPAQTAALATGHIGASVKIWAKAQGVPVGVLATAAVMALVNGC